MTTLATLFSRGFRSAAACLAASLVALTFTWAQKPIVDRIDPPNWWIGMKLDSLRLLLYGDHLDHTVASSLGDGLTVRRTIPAASPHYLFVDVIVRVSANSRTPTLVLARGKDSIHVSFPLFAREHSPSRYQGFSPGDVLYLLTPDRFCNGDPSNDSVPGMLEGVHRDQAFGRHGGDIAGILKHLGYFSALGVTALWINPLIENNNPWQSYHGYAATDLYRIDPRFGTNALYRELVREAHARGIKIILDHVANHISINHPWMHDLPTSTWINGSIASHDYSHHAKSALFDPHFDSSTVRNLLDGWFVNEMPDLNQNDPSLAAYLIQNTIWWIESTGLDGIREDTYPYVEPGFWPKWCGAILNEYPTLNIFGEVWIGEPAFLAPFQKGSTLSRRINPVLPAVTDFALYDEINRVFGDHQNIYRIYECLSKDYLYANANNLVTFVDNHDVRRVLAEMRGDTARVELALTLLLTTRGIPALYYGTEIGIWGGNNDGLVRADFPGGFAGDSSDCFTEAGRTAAQQALFNVVRRLVHLRTSHPALATGRLVQFMPSDDVYCYVRRSDNEQIFVAINSGSQERTVDLSKIMHTAYPPLFSRDLMDDRELPRSSTILVGPLAAKILLLTPAAK